VATNPSDRLLLLNPAAKDAFEIEDDNWANQPLNEVIQNQTLADLWTPSPPMVGEIPLKDGRTLWASVTEVPSVGRVAVLRDISQFKALDEAKSEIITTFTHDLGAPLAVVKGYVELIKMDGPLNKQQMHDLTGITEAADQMKAIVEDLLELGQIEAVEDLRGYSQALKAHAPGDVLKIQLPDQKVLSHYPMQRGAVAMVISGSHTGGMSTVEQRVPTRGSAEDLIEFADGFSTVKSNVFVVGTDKAEVSVPEVSI